MNTNTSKPFALITGASEGFGKALAFECASRNMNLVLVALPGPELHHLASFISKNYLVETVCIEADLSRIENCQQVFEQVKEQGIKINVLINNAGLGGTHSFEEKNTLDYQRQIQLN